MSHAANAGALVRINPNGYAFPVGGVAEPDSGAIVLYVDQAGTAYAQRVDRHGKTMWAGAGLLVHSGVGNQYTYPIISDGSGGMIYAWQEDRGATGVDVLVQRILPNGTLGYAASGLVVCNAVGTQGEPQLVEGASGNYHVIWSDERTGGSDADVYAQRLTAAGSVQWTVNGVRVNSASTIPVFSVGAGGRASVASDGQGAIMVGWLVDATRINRIQRLNTAGTLLWGADGLAYGAANDGAGEIAPDGFGGAWIVYNHISSPPNGTPYLQHALFGGTLAFAPNGVNLNMGLSSGQFSSYEALPIRNSTTGCMVYGIGWSGSSGAVRRQEVTAAGALLRGTGEQLGYASNLGVFDLGSAVVLQMIEDGNPRSKAELRRYGYDGTSLYPASVFLGRPEPQLVISPAPPTALANGVTMVFFTDSRYFKPLNQLKFPAFGQAYGTAGDPLWDDSEPPTIVSAGDAPNDQGGLVRLHWTSGVADTMGEIVTEYRAWRSVPPGQAARLMGARPALDGRFTFEGRTFLAQANAFWEMVGSQPAAQLGGYALTVPTGQDSSAGASANESFMVQAVDDSNHVWWTSALTGHSVDNLAPPAPAPASGYYAGGSTSLYWGGVSVGDLCCYEVYRGGSAGFTPGPGNLVGTTADVTYTDNGGGSYFYRIGARDIHGNLGPTALVMPSGTLDVGDGSGPRAWRLAARWHARALTLSLDVPQADEGRVDLYDVAGRSLWSTRFSTSAAQSLTLRAGNDLPAGIVFARVRAASGRVLDARAIVLR